MGVVLGLAHGQKTWCYNCQSNGWRPHDNAMCRGDTSKARVQMDITKPLKNGVNVGSKKDGVNWVGFQYVDILDMMMFL